MSSITISLQASRARSASFQNMPLKDLILYGMQAYAAEIVANRASETGIDSGIAPRISNNVELARNRIHRGADTLAAAGDKSQSLVARDSQ